MYKLSLNSSKYKTQIKSLISNWSDDSRIIMPLIIIKISEAFKMYHQISREDWNVQNRNFSHQHPVLINDLDTGFNILLIMDTNGRILHVFLINDYGKLKQNDSLLKMAHKNIHQKYLDYFYCICKNVERYVTENAGK